MKLLDVNVLVTAHRADAPGHAQVAAWLDGIVNGVDPFGFSDLVMSGFVRVVTHPRVFKSPTPLAEALDFAARLRGAAPAVPIAPGPRHWEIFAHLCSEAGASGNLVADAYHAALAIESGCEWITLDGDFARFPGLRHARPMD